MIRSIVCGSLMLLALLSSGCATQGSYDYSALQASKPRSILVIPPMNNSVEINASNIYLSTLSRPLAEKGYYVFPVAVINQFLQENGLQSPADMHDVPLDKFAEHLNPDAILYIVIEDWGQKYEILSSTTVVKANMTLVDAKTGTTLWETRVSYAQGSGDNGGGLVGMLVQAVVDQVVGTMVDQTPTVARAANNIAINNPGQGLLNGPYRAQ
ncbi:DUF799 domain-containing protein [Amphritea sp.]|uniref:DUF799 domain-containing protein n=1 Tax=Amphritea sp. TaxID=1872502 RepID=UPI003D13B8FC